MTCLVAWRIRCHGIPVRLAPSVRPGSRGRTSIDSSSTSDDRRPVDSVNPSRKIRSTPRKLSEIHADARWSLPTGCLEVLSWSCGLRSFGVSIARSVGTSSVDMPSGLSTVPDYLASEAFDREDDRILRLLTAWHFVRCVTCEGGRRDHCDTNPLAGTGEQQRRLRHAPAPGRRASARSPSSTAGSPADAPAARSPSPTSGCTASETVSSAFPVAGRCATGSSGTTAAPPRIRPNRPVAA